MNDWKSVDLRGASSIERICNVYEISALARLPGGYFKIKVMENREGSYEAVANVQFKAPDGDPYGYAGAGDSELDALQQCLQWFMRTLNERAEWAPEDFCWTDPVRF